MIFFPTEEWLTIQREVHSYLEDCCSKQWARITALNKNGSFSLGFTIITQLQECAKNGIALRMRESTADTWYLSSWQVPLKVSGFSSVEASSRAKQSFNTIKAVFSSRHQPFTLFTVILLTVSFIIPYCLSIQEDSSSALCINYYPKLVNSYCYRKFYQSSLRGITNLFCCYCSRV